MTDEFIEAAARVIRFLGEAILRDNAAELARLALELAAVDVGVGGVPRGNLKAAADALSQAAGSSGRLEAVLALLDAATELEDALGADMESLRGGASFLALTCRELQEEQREERPAAGPWWWLLLRGWLPRRHEKSVENLEAALLVKDQVRRQQPDLRFVQCEMAGLGFNFGGCLQGAGETNYAAQIAIDFMCKESAQRDNLVKMACEIQQFADDLGFPHHDLDRATAALMVADNASAAFVKLGTAATELEREATAQLHALRAPMVQLADACRKHVVGAKGMKVLLLADEERARQKAACASTRSGMPNSRLWMVCVAFADYYDAPIQSFQLHQLLWQDFSKYFSTDFWRSSTKDAIELSMQACTEGDILALFYSFRANLSPSSTRLGTRGICDSSEWE